MNWKWLALSANSREKLCSNRLVERWQSGLTRTPGKREYPKGIGGSNPPLSASFHKHKYTYIENETAARPAAAANDHRKFLFCEAMEKVAIMTAICAANIP